MDTTDYLTSHQAAEAIGVAQVTVRYRIRHGLIDAVLVDTPRGKLWLIHKDEVERARREGRYPRPKAHTRSPGLPRLAGASS